MLDNMVVRASSYRKLLSSPTGQPIASCCILPVVYHAAKCQPSTNKRGRGSKTANALMDFYPRKRVV